MSFNLIKNIRHYGFKRLLLAVSGGLDSICLAHYFIENKEVLGIEWLGIAHVHHGLREGTADRDAAFVEAFAKAHNVPFFLKKLDGDALKAMDGSLEENARDARYKALVEIAHSCEQSAVSNEEKEIPASAGMTEKNVEPRASYLFRPLLSVTREDLLAYAREHNLTWCEDESNADVKFARNKVRHELLPQLENACPGATAQLCRIASLADRAYKKVLDAADKLYAPAIVPPDTWPFEASCAKYGKVLALDAGALSSIPHYPELLRLWLDSRGFRFPVDTFAKPNPIYTGNPQTMRTLSFRTRFIEKCRHIVWIYDSNTILAPSNLYFSNEKQRFSGISGQWRHPQQGDILSPMDMKISPRKLAEWLQEKGIPRWERDSLQVFAQGTRVLFVSGIRTENSKRKGLK